MAKNLEYLIRPISKKAFFSHYYEKKYLHVSEREKNYFSKILTLKDIDKALAIKAIPLKNIFLTKQSKATLDNWISWKKNKGVYLDYEKLSNALNNGNSIVINALNDYVFNLNKFVDAFSRELFVFAWTNIYITPPSFQAFNPHFDTHDVFVLQIQGKKHWKIYDNPVILPDKSESYKNKELLENYRQKAAVKEILLVEGDLLYIPRGVVHEAIATDELSIHITLGVNSPRVIDLMESIEQEVLKDAFFKRSLFVNNQSLDSENFLLFKEKLHTIIDNLSYEEISEFVKKKLAEKYYSNTENKAVISNYVKQNNINLQTKIAKKNYSNYRMEINGHLLKLQIDYREEEYPFFLKSFFSSILSSGKEGIALQDIEANFGEVEVIKLAKRLVNEGIFKILD